MIDNKPEQGERNIWRTLYALDRRVLYAILIVLVSWQVISPIDAPNIVTPMSQDFYSLLDGLEEQDFVVIQSDWTNSTRGESRGQFEALMRLLMRKRVRFVITCVADPQIPNILRPVINQVARAVSREPGMDGYEYRENRDWAMAGYFPNAEAHNLGMVNDIRAELEPKGVTATPVMEGINDLSDAKAVVLVTASSSINLWYERIRNKAPLGLMCTAVMSAENVPYFVSGQLFGLVIGAKGAFDMESLLDEEFPETAERKNFSAGRRYMSPLALALGLLILSVVVGNVAMFVLRKKGLAP